MQEPPSPLDYLAAYGLAFGLGVLSAWTWVLSHRRGPCWRRRCRQDDSQSP